jgi:hypothetical protein
MARGREMRLVAWRTGGWMQSLGFVLVWVGFPGFEAGYGMAAGALLGALVCTTSVYYVRWPEPPTCWV